MEAPFFMVWADLKRKVCTERKEVCIGVIISTTHLIRETNMTSHNRWRTKAIQRECSAGYTLDETTDIRTVSHTR